MKSDWDYAELSDVTRMYSGGTPSKSQGDYWGGGIPWISARDMQGMRLVKTTLELTMAGAATVRVMPPGTVFVLIRGMTLFRDLPIVLSDTSAAFNQDVKALVAGPRLLPGFLAYSLVAHKNQILQFVTQAGHGTGRLDSSRLGAFPLPVPSLAEQRKIVEILSAWDDAIDSRSSLAKLKKSALQMRTSELFESIHSGGECTVSLGDLFDERSDTTTDPLPLLSVTQHNGVVRQSSAGRKDSSSADRSKYKRVVKGDIAYNTMRMWQGASGLVPEDGIVSPAYTVVTPRASSVEPRFASYLFKSKRMMFDFERYSQGITSDTWNLKYPAFSKILITLPSLSKQSQVADQLEVANEELVLLAQEVALLREQKRGLMQKLLTGGARVSVESEEDQP